MILPSFKLIWASCLLSPVTNSVPVAPSRQRRTTPSPDFEPAVEPYYKPFARLDP